MRASGDDSAVTSFSQTRAYVHQQCRATLLIPQFIEDNWLKGERLGGGSFDATTGSIVDMFDFNQKKTTKLILDPTFGTVDTKEKVKN